MTAATSPAVLKFQEAKALLRCSDSTLLDCVRAGTVKGFKLGGTWRFYRNDLMALGGGGTDDAAPDVRPICSRRRA